MTTVTEEYSLVKTDRENTINPTDYLDENEIESPLAS